VVLLDRLAHHGDALFKPLKMNWHDMAVELTQVPEIDHVLRIDRLKDKGVCAGSFNSERKVSADRSNSIGRSASR